MDAVGLPAALRRHPRGYAALAPVLQPPQPCLDLPLIDAAVCCVFLTGTAYSDIIVSTSATAQFDYMLELLMTRRYQTLVCARHSISACR